MASIDKVGPRGFVATCTTPSGLGLKAFGLKVAPTLACGAVRQVCLKETTEEGTFRALGFSCYVCIQMRALASVDFCALHCDYCYCTISTATTSLTPPPPPKTVSAPCPPLHPTTHHPTHPILFIIFITFLSYFSSFYHLYHPLYHLYHEVYRLYHLFIIFIILL